MACVGEICLTLHRLINYRTIVLYRNRNNLPYV